MPYYVRVGDLKNNLSGTTCKGYYIRRNNKSVIIRWGAINVVGWGGGKYFWQGPNLPFEKIIKRKSIREAKEYIKSKHEQKTQPIFKGESKGGYRKLPPGVKIHPYRNR